MIEAKKHLVPSLGALAVFVLLGVIFSPGVTRREPAPPNSSSALRSPLDRAATSARPNRISLGDRSPVGEATSGGNASPEAFDCMIQPNEVVEIGSAITGLIDEIPVERSDYVSRGDVVASLESGVERAALKVAQANAERSGEIQSSLANLELGRRKRDRGIELYKSDSLSLDVRETLETELALAKARLKQAEENQSQAWLQLQQSIATLERRTIRSPVSGYVIERLMSPGEVVEDQTILRIAQVDPLRVEVILPVHLFGHVRPGDSAEIVPEAPRNKPRTAEVAIVDPIIDGASATFGALLLLPNEDRSLPAGLRCQVNFLTGDVAAAASEVQLASEVR